MTAQLFRSPADRATKIEQGEAMTRTSRGASAFDSALIAARTGDGRGFERLYRLFARRIAGYVAARGAAEPDEIANEVLYRVFNKLDDFDGDESAFAAWVFTIAHNLAIDSHRATARRPAVVDAAVPDSSVVAAEVIALDNLHSADVLASIYSLTEAQRDVILLRVVADLSLKQVAAALDKPVTAIKALQRRGLRQLAANLIEGGE